MNKTTTDPEKPYVDPFLFQVGFCKDESDRDKLMQQVSKLSQRDENRPKKAKK